jgi:alkyl hydroperoxide reductase subunit F
VLAIRGRDWVTAVRIQSGDRISEVKADGIVINVGVIPNTEWCKTALELDDEGFIKVDAELKTSRPRVWAVGDVTRPKVPSLALAIGQGAQAAAALRAVLRPA